MIARSPLLIGAVALSLTMVVGLAAATHTLRAPWRESCEHARQWGKEYMQTAMSSGGLLALAGTVQTISKRVLAACDESDFPPGEREKLQQTLNNLQNTKRELRDLLSDN
jgi:hypothetical protein